MYLGLGTPECYPFVFPVSWYPTVEKLLLESPLYLRMCWIKAVSGGWCTSHRLHLDPLLPCIFGCEEKDEIRHYLLCPVLWQLCREYINYNETSKSIESRLCIAEPTIDKLRALSFCHSLYHACINDSVCIDNGGNVCCSSIVQQRASEISRYVRHLVVGEPADNT